MRSPSHPARPRRAQARGTVVFVGAVWLAGLAAGYSALIGYESTPGQEAQSPDQRPAALAARSDPARDTLHVFAHPRCPCTRASLSELDRLVARCAERLAVVVWFYEEPALGEAWTHCDLWEQAARIPGVDVRADRDGAIARACGVSTSGQVILYAADGRMQFEGGITAARGHAGDNAGQDAIEACVQGREPLCRSTPVFGCSFGFQTSDGSPGRVTR